MVFTLADGTQETARHKFLALCCGGLSKTKIPNTPGLWTYKGKVFHSADWPEDLSTENLRGKEVLVVGNGCSGFVCIMLGRIQTTYVAVCRLSGRWHRTPKSRSLGSQLRHNGMRLGEHGSRSRSLAVLLIR